MNGPAAARWGFAQEPCRPLPAIIDLSLAIRGRSSSGFDHGRSLHVREFLDTPLSLNDVANLQWEISVLVFLSNLQTWQMREPQFHLILIQKVLGHCAFDCLTIFQLQRKTLHLSRAPRKIANSIFSKFVVCIIPSIISSLISPADVVVPFA